MTIKAGKSAPDTCVLGALRAFGLVVPLLFDRLSASTASLHVARLVKKLKRRKNGGRGKSAEALS